MFDISDLWDPKFRINPTHKIATYGSCFAQHIGRALRGNGFQWVDAESAPNGLSAENLRRFNYGIFSARTENIYTTTMLAQWVDWSQGRTKAPEEVWERDGRFYDPFRPRVEPTGFASRKELLEARAWTMECFRQSYRQSDVFVFTLGLTERWLNRQAGYEYAICPGTAAGTFDPDAHVFDNLQFVHVLNALSHSMEKMREDNPRLRFLLTVSPVPLTATKSSRHILVATMESKSILRAVAGQLAANRPYVDYFPSYEIINSPAFKGAFFEPNQRTVNPFGVDFVMRSFFTGLGLPATPATQTPAAPTPATATRARAQTTDDTLCTEELLDAFSKP